MDDKKIKKFIKLAGQDIGTSFLELDPKTRELGAQLLLSETLEYIIKGLGVVPSFNEIDITDPNGLKYCSKDPVSKLEMLDGLADVAYTMFWNSVRFGIPLEEGFDLVCDNNLDKFVCVDGLDFKVGDVDSQNWGLGKDVTWPENVSKVSIIDYQGSLYAVGFDKTGKVRKPSSYKSVDLKPLVANAS